MASGILYGQTGAVAPVWDEVRGATLYMPEPQAGELSRVDLRGNFPPIGEQKMNDCTAWAVAAIKGYLEAFDQRWKPDHPSRQFSTAFIYNQINDGKDLGSDPIAASKLLIEKGAARLDHMPYRAGNYTEQPSTPIFNSAALFRNTGHKLLRSGSEIRKALQQNQPVLIAARLTPPFFSIRSANYTSQTHTKGMEIRRPDQPHALHAMVVVGYDDTRGAFLVRNSWGTQWGNRGYTWVDYDVMERIDNRKQSEAFLLLAMTLQDQLLPVARPEDRKTMEVNLQASEPVFDVRLQQYVRRYSISISAPEETLRRIGEVSWDVDAVDGRHRLVSSDRDSNFRVWAVGTERLVKGSAVVQFLDGARQIVRFDRPLPPEERAKRSARIDWRSQRIHPTSEYWQIRLMIDADAAELNDIARVEYYYQRRNNRSILGQSGNLRDNFALDWRLHKDSRDTVFADVIYADGSTLTVSSELKIEEPASANPVICWSLHPTGVPGLGYAYRVWVEMPRQVNSVTWEVDGTQGYRSVYRDNLWDGFAFEGTARHSFDVRLEYRDPSINSNRGVHQRITLPEDAFTNDYELTVMPQARYLGKNAAGKPQHQVALAVTGNTGPSPKLQIDNSNSGNRIEWVDDNGVLQTFRLEPPVWNDDPTMLPQEHLLTTRRSFPVEVVLYGQRGDEPMAEHRFKETVDLGEPPSDFIEPLVAVHKGDSGAARWEADFSAAPQARQIRRIVAEYDVPALLPDGKSRQVIASSVFFDETTAENASRKVGRALGEYTVMAFQLYYLDGAREAIDLPDIEIDKPLPAYARPGGVRLLERFGGADAKGGSFVAEFRLEGDNAFIESVEQVQLRITAEPEGAKGEQDAWSFKPGQTLKIPLSRPTAFEVSIHYKNGEPEKSLLRAACLPQREHELRLIRESNSIALVGPQTQLDAIASASLSMRDFSAPLMAPADPVPWSVTGAGTPRFYSEEVFDTGSGATYTAELTAVDGSVTEVGAALPLPESPRRQPTSRYWGKIDNVPHWLVRIPLQDREIADVKQVRYEFIPDDAALPGLELHSTSYPDYAAYLLVRCGGKVRATVESESLGTTTLPEQSIALEPAPAEALSLQSVPTANGQEWLLSIDGPLSLLEGVASVTYTFEGRAGSSAWHSNERFSLHGDGFHSVHFGKDKPAGTATVHYRSGKTENLPF